MSGADTVQLGLTHRASPFGGQVRELARRIIGPTCGLVPSLGLMLRRRHDPRVVTAAAELTGVHQLVGCRPVDAARHHIGATSLTLNDAAIRSLAESVERYAHYAHTAYRSPTFTFASYAALAERGADLPSPDLFTAFDDEQLATPGFPFARFAPDAPLSWWRMTELTGAARPLVPAQFTLVGYRPRVADGESRYQAAVSTGTAAHTDPAKALLNAIQELVQLDAVIGHWYSETRSVRIRLDRRTRTLAGLIDTYWTASAPRPEFQLLPSPDLPGHTVACLVSGPAPAGPAIAVGLGADLTLTNAMYKALLEAVALEGMITWSPIIGGGEADEPAGFYDLDRNVLHYADPANAHVVADRFARCTSADAADLGPDVVEDSRRAVRLFLDAFQATGKRLFHADLTTPDVARLGFRVSRVWSPDILPLPLPGAPAKLHRRFRDYGGFRHDHPHPYP